MKRLALLLVAMSIIFAAFVNAADNITVYDNEKGWVNNEIRFNGVDWLNNSVYTTEAETQSYDMDGDSFSLAWNYSLNAAVNDKEYDYIEKNLEEPLIGGTFSMSVLVREGVEADPNGFIFEIIGYEPNGTTHVLTKTGVLPLSSTNWNKISANLPVGKKIVRVGIKLLNGGTKATCWGVLNIDDIKFTNTTKGDYTRISETNWLPVTRTTESPTVTNAAFSYYYEGDGVIVLSGGVTPDLDYLKSISMTKSLESPIKDGYF